MRSLCHLPGMNTSKLVVIFLITTMLSCKKTGNGNNTIPDKFPDFVTRINSTVSGFVTNENDDPVMGADVKCATATAVTDEYGYFEFKNIQVIKESATLTVSYPGYFNCVKTYSVTEGKKNFVRIKLLQRRTIGTINAASGGSLSSPQGLQLSFPANAVKDATTGLAYSGTVTVAAAWLDPTSTELHKIMPGDLRGINANGVMKNLTSYGMAAVELTGVSGEILQIAENKKVTIHFPLPAMAAATAPANIPLWYFDDESGFWKEEGEAVKNGNTYSAEVAHFTFWNCDMPNSYVTLQARVVSSSGQPLSNILVKLTDLSNSMGTAGSYTSDEGFVSGRVPLNTEILVEVLLEDQNCTQFFSKTINTGTADISLGDLVLSPDAKLAMVKGTVTNCNNNPVENGYILVKYGKGYTKHLFNMGAYDFVTPVCYDTVTFTLLAVDLAAGKQSAIINKAISKGENLIAPLQSCYLSTYEYFSYAIDGGSPTVLTEVSNGSAGYDVFGNTTGIVAVRGCCSALSNFGIVGDTTVGIHSSTAVTQVWDLPYGYYSNTVFPVTVTEYGKVGEFISGSYIAAPFIGGPGSGQHTITVRFRLRRTF